VHRVKFVIIKPTKCTNFLNLFLEWNSTCFGQFLCPSSGVSTVDSNGTCQRCLLTAVRKPVWHTPLLCTVESSWWRTEELPEKHVEFDSKDKFEILVHLVGLITGKLILVISPYYYHAKICSQHCVEFPNEILWSEEGGTMTVDNTVLLVNEVKLVWAESIKALLCKVHSSEIWRYVDS
jgi:hypothetical protein